MCVVGNTPVRTDARPGRDPSGTPTGRWRPGRPAGHRDERQVNGPPRRPRAPGTSTGPAARSDGDLRLEALGGLDELLDHREDDVLGLPDGGGPPDDLAARVEVHVLGLFGIA